MIELSIVIPTYNRIGTLREVIPSLLAQDLSPESYEIIVADSQSNDGTLEFLQEVAARDPRVRHQPGPYNGRAMARNAGIAAARGRVVLFTDADIIASPDLAARHLAHHANNEPLAVVGQELQVSSFEEYVRQRDDPSQRKPLHPSTRKRVSWLYFLTGNASVRRADLEYVGGFDENFTGYGHEDLELGYRLQASGVKIIYDARAVNYHWHPVSYEEQMGRMELAGRSTVRFHEKHPSFTVELRLGMTPISRVAQRLLQKSPRLLEKLHAAGGRNKLARDIVHQYHYVTGINAALAERDRRGPTADTAKG